MACSPDDLAKYKSRLIEAENALHDVLTGNKVVRVADQSGDSVTYSSANVSRLRTYISELKALIAGGCASVNSGPIRPVFL